MIASRILLFSRMNNLLLLGESVHLKLQLAQRFETAQGLVRTAHNGGNYTRGVHVQKRYFSQGPAVMQIYIL